LEVNFLNTDYRERIAKIEVALSEVRSDLKNNYDMINELRQGSVEVSERVSKLEGSMKLLLTIELAIFVQLLVLILS